MTSEQQPTPPARTPSSQKSEKSEKTEKTEKTENGSPQTSWWRRLASPEGRFLIGFMVLLGTGFVALSLNSINDLFVVPFTSLVAKSSGWALAAIGQDVKMNGTQILSSRFAVDIQNGCNGLETVVIFVAAVLAFPASLRAKGAGLLLGVLAIQAVNLIRVVALFLTGAYLPRLFDSSHTVIWQTIVIAFGVLLWMFWANRFAVNKAGQNT
jgi:exosortase H (IPTLxxWG-CTERM-specific)